MKCKVFDGCATALVTPFDGDAIDYKSFERIVERQTEGGIDALVFAGTTGEAPTLTRSEWEQVCRFAVSVRGSGVKVIVGCGSNSTSEAANRVKYASKLGADAALVVTPYYNKASSKGLVDHYRAVCEASDIPVIAYNVPSRTGVDLGISALDDLVGIPNLAGIKEASGSVSRAACLLSRYGDELPLYSGSDEVTLPILSIGGSGAVSVVSNVFPKICASVCKSAVKRDFSSFASVSASMHQFISALFSEVNPIPVKTVLAHLGLCRETFRLPMCKMSEDKKKALLAEYEKLRNVI